MKRGRIRPEAGERMQRCCPYCFRPLAWHYTPSKSLTREHPYVDLKSERPHCRQHGPVPFWVVVDHQHAVRVNPRRDTVPELVLSDEIPVLRLDPKPNLAFKPAIVAIATVDDLPCVVRQGRRLARVLPRFLRKPLLLDDCRRASARWKTTRRGRNQGRLFSIDLAALERQEWTRRAA